MTFKPQPTQPKASTREVDKTQESRAQPLVACDMCHRPSDKQGGVEVKGKWYCGQCWIRWLHSK